MKILTQAKGQAGALHRAFDGGAAHFAIALEGMSIAYREERAWHRDR